MTKNAPSVSAESDVSAETAVLSPQDRIDALNKNKILSRITRLAALEVDKVKKALPGISFDRLTDLEIALVDRSLTLDELKAILSLVERTVGDPGKKRHVTSEG